jgi:hypothetical protein
MRSGSIVSRDSFRMKKGRLTGLVGMYNHGFLEELWNNISEWQANDQESKSQDLYQ